MTSRAMPKAKAGPPPRGVSPAIDLPDLAGVADRPQTLLGGLILAIGGIWIATPLLALFGDAPPLLPGLGVVGTSVLVAIGVGHVLWALELLVRRRTLIIEQHALHASVRGLMGVRHWSEPLANYRGLRHRRERVRHRYGWRVVHRLELAHPDPAKEIDLTSARGERPVEAARRQWADWLGLPVWSRDNLAYGQSPCGSDRREPWGENKAGVGQYVVPLPLDRGGPGWG